MGGRQGGGTGVSALDEALIAAHAAGNKTELVQLYTEAAEAAAGEAAAFYLTHAYVFALEAGDPRAASLRAALVAMKAETG